MRAMSKTKRTQGDLEKMETVSFKLSAGIFKVLEALAQGEFEDSGRPLTPATLARRIVVNHLKSQGLLKNALPEAGTPQVQVLHSLNPPKPRARR